MSTLAFLGYGRFGAALGTLFREAGHAVRALDPHADIPAGLGAASLAELVHGAEYVVVAVPVPEMPGAFAALRPHLGAQQTVLDVGSVKVSPAVAMDAAFGGAIPWVGTHPLFGPVSLLRGERPLRIVVCPAAAHPAAAARVEALFAQIGCEVTEQDAHAHDRSMAWTHALAFFVAKGMLDAGVPEDATYAPPSFQAIARTIETVRADAGHLFGVLHRENPYAAEARHALLASLSAMSKEIEDPGSGPRGAPQISIPDLGAHSPDLRETRELIDDVDQELLGLLRRRALLARRAAAAKAAKGLAVRDPRREADLLEARRRDAERLGLDPDSIADIFESILRFSRKLQES